MSELLCAFKRTFCSRAYHNGHSVARGLWNDQASFMIRLPIQSITAREAYSCQVCVCV